MRTSLLTLTAALSSNAIASVFEATNTLPSAPTPYVVRHLEGPKVLLADDVFRTLADVAVTTNGSANDAAHGFSALLTSGKVNFIVPPHYHVHWHETFIPMSGHVRVWVNGHSRDLTEGDFAMVPHYTNHSYQFVSPETEFLGIIQPAGFDEFFANFSKPWTPTYNVPYPATGGVFPAAAFAEAAKPYDVQRVSMPTPVPSSSPDWYEKNATLPNDAETPYYLANGDGPHWWYEPLGAVVSPLAMRTQTNGNFTLAQISMRKTTVNGTNSTTPTWISTSHQFIYGMHGQVRICVAGEEHVELIRGDSMFIPAYTNFTIENKMNYNKFFLAAGGCDGIDSQMVVGGKKWGYAMPPAQ